MKNRHDNHEEYTAPTRTPDFAEESRDECSLVNFRDKLKKIQAGFYSVQVGEQLNIRIDGINVLTAHKNGIPCGNIISHYNGTMVTCIRNGRSFYAKVMTKQGDIHVFCA
jgi:hypothetical protein